MTDTDIVSQRIRELYERYTSATATLDELTEFFSLTADPANKEIVEHLLSGTWDELYEKGNELRLLKEAPVRKIKITRILQWTAAAVIILFLGFSLYFMSGTKIGKPTMLPVIAKANEIAPGSNKATLVLSTGQQIILDSAGKGQIAKFGNTTITKTDSGKLTYTSSGSKSSDEETTFNTLITPRGGMYELILPDGTKAWLNAASRIDYPTWFSGKNREVYISGEVYFEVAHNAAHPFLVSLSAKTREQGERGHWMQIEVLGTHFNVNTYDDAKTTLLEGSIKVIVQNHSKTIRPGEQASVAFGSREITIKNNVDLDRIMAWRYGKIALTDVTVRQLMTEISRWYDMDIEYKGSIPDKQFYGSIRRDVPLSTVLHALQAYGVETIVEGKKIIIQ